jgi:hypothetical protein
VSLRRRHFVLGGLCAILLASCVAVWVWLPKTRQERERRALADVAETLGIEPCLVALMDHISSTLEIGMSYEEVHSRLKEVGPYSVKHNPGLSWSMYRLNWRMGYGETIVFSFRWGVILKISLGFDALKSLRFISRTFS